MMSLAFDDRGVFLTKITIWLALGGYALGAAALLLSTRQPQWRRRARYAWVFGCALFLAHVICAFAYYHDWSHGEAYLETARQTHEMLGFSFGAGIFVSYLFTLVWLADVFWWMLSPQSHERRPSWLAAALHGFLIFIIFNGTVIFESGPVRWFGAVISAGLCVMWWANRNRRLSHEGFRLKEGEEV